MTDFSDFRFPTDWVKQHPVHGFDYVPWYRYAEVLDGTVGHEGWSVPRIEWLDVAGKLMCTVAVEINNVVKVNVGDEDQEMSGYGSAATNAYAQGFKRACALHGIGRYLYHDDEVSASVPAESRPQEPAPRQAPPPSSGNPLDGMVGFGKYRDSTWQYVIETDPKYIDWALKNTDRIDDVIRAALSPEGKQEQAELVADFSSEALTDDLPF